MFEGFTSWDLGFGALDHEANPKSKIGQGALKNNLGPPSDGPELRKLLRKNMRKPHLENGKACRSPEGSTQSRFVNAFTLNFVNLQQFSEETKNEGGGGGGGGARGTTKTQQ